MDLKLGSSHSERIFNGTYGVIGGHPDLGSLHVIKDRMDFKFGGCNHQELGFLYCYFWGHLRSY